MRKLNVPAALFIGLVVSFVGSFAVTAATIVEHERGDFASLMRWFTFDAGAAVAGALLVAGALFAVTDRVTGASRVFLQITAWSHAAVAAWYIADPLIAAMSHDDAVYEKIEYVYRAAEFTAFVGLVALSIAARAWTQPGAVTVLAILGLIAKLCGTWTPYLGPWLSDHIWSGGPAVQLAWLCRNGALCVGIVAMVHGTLSGTSEAVADPRRAVAGFRLAGRALLVRVLAAIGLALVGVSILQRSGGIKLMLFIGPSLMIVSTLAFCIGLLWVDRANLPGMPRIRVLLGVALIACAVGLDLAKLQGLSQDSSSADRVWTIATPLISLAGIVLIVSAVHRFAAFRQNAHLGRNVSSRATLFFTMMGVSVLMPIMAGGLVTSAESVVVLVLLATVCGVIGIVSLAGMMSLMADALSDAPQLPQARLRS